VGAYTLFAEISRKLIGSLIKLLISERRSFESDRDPMGRTLDLSFKKLMKAGIAGIGGGGLIPISGKRG